MLLKTLLASLAAKIAVGTGLALATVSAAGAAGVLPDPAQQAVAAVVEAATPFDLADQAVEDLQDPVDSTTTTSSTSTTVASDDDDEAGDDGVTDKVRKANHGACVSTVAKNTSGPDKGKTVSSVARSDCGKKTSTSVAPTSSTTSTTVAGGSTTSSTIDDGERSANSGRGDSGKSGKAKSGNSGKK